MCRYLDIWMIVVFVYPFIVMTLHTVLQIINKKRGKGCLLHRILLNFGQVILPIIFLLYCGIYFYLGVFYTTQIQTTNRGAFDGALQ